MSSNPSPRRRVLQRHRSVTRTTSFAAPRIGEGRDARPQAGTWVGAPVGLCVDHLRDADDEDLLPASSFWIATVCSPRTHRDAYVGVVAAPSVAVGDTGRNRRGATRPSFRGQRAGAAPVLRPCARSVASSASSRCRVGLDVPFPLPPGDDCVAGPASIDMGRYRGIRAADPGTQYLPRRDYHAPRVSQSWVAAMVCRARQVGYRCDAAGKIQAARRSREG